MEKIKSFTCFDNYYKLYKHLNDSEKVEYMDGIFEYMFKGKIKDNFKSEKAQDYFEIILISLKKTKKKILAGQKGGSSSKSTSDEEQIDDEDTSKNESKTPSKEDSKNQAEIQTNIISKFFNSKFLFLNDNNKQLLCEEINKWIKYKQEKKKQYTETGLKSLLTRVENNTKKYGTSVMINLIEDSIVNNYQGIIFDKLKKLKPIEEDAEEDNDWEFYEYNGVKYKRNSKGENIAIGVVE